MPLFSHAPTKRGLMFSLALAALTIVFPQRSAHAQANLTFTGGNGTPLTITVLNPITYTISSADAVAPIFVFQGVGNPFGNTNTTVTGTVTVSINGGLAQPLFEMNSGRSGGVIDINDIITYDGVPGVSVGDIVTLSAGTITSTNNVTGTIPTNGLYNTFVVSNGALRLSPNGVIASNAPEPGTLALLTGACLIVGGLTTRRRR